MDNTPTDPPPTIEIALRVPGPWESPEQLARALPPGYRLSGDGETIYLHLPPGDAIDRVPLAVFPFDEAFVRVFAGGCERTPSESDRAGVESHAALVCPIFPGGSVERAETALRHSAALLRAGGFGVYVDNSGVAHGSDDWLEMSGDAEDAAMFALVGRYAGSENRFSIGMHALGLRDATIVGSDDDRALRNFLLYSMSAPKPIEDGHTITDGAIGEAFHVTLAPDDTVEPPHPMHNPIGRFVLERTAGVISPSGIARGPG